MSCVVKADPFDHAAELGPQQHAGELLTPSVLLAVSETRPATGEAGLWVLVYELNLGPSQSLTS